MTLDKLKFTWVVQAFASTAVVGVALHFVITTISSIKSTLGGVVLIITIIVSKPLWGSTIPHGLCSSKNKLILQGSHLKPL